MTAKHQRLADPWNDLTDCSLYEQLALADVGPATTLTEIRDRYFELMESGMVTGSLENAYNAVQVLSRRLFQDVMMYDAELAGELLDFPRGFAETLPREEPFRSRLQFAWEV
ncbi:MAG: hypothetical protein FJ276_18290 [Planctomycetes bacterium]|nr:hypothetical protein [Planctomycetota bacterium]